MGDRKKDGLGRALLRQRNQMIAQQKQKGVALRSQNRRVLESYTETSDLEAVLENADEAARVADPTPTVRLTNPRSTRDEREEALHASSLRVPRRPPWDSRMSPEELDSNERDAFLKWRRSLARLEENDKLVLTPFEKNLDIWRQLWRVLERSHLLVMVVDGRDPLFYRCPDLEAYAKEKDEHKKTMLLINKADLLPVSVRKMWAEYFKRRGILFVFWSAKAASDTLDCKKTINQESFHPTDAEDIKIYSRDALLARLQAEAETIKASSNEKEESTNNHSADSGRGASKHVVVGFVGYPNVGKSSTINALAGVKRTGVTSTPGKTKHFQTLIISDELILCDCPGLVFPSFSSSRYDMIACGVLPIDRMTENREAVQIVANHVPRNVLEETYNISLPKPKTYEPKTRPPLASELLRAYCASRGYVASSGLPDETRAARQILKDYIDGKLPHFEMPPLVSDVEMEVSIANGSPSSSTLSGHMSDSCGSDSDDSSPNKDSNAKKNNLENLLDDLDSFDMVTGLSSNAAAMKKKKSSPAAMKHHKKPQRKKDRSWRVENDGGDGMPVVRVFQKAPTPK